MSSSSSSDGECRINEDVCVVSCLEPTVSCLDTLKSSSSSSIFVCSYLLSDYSGLILKNVGSFFEGYECLIEWFKSFGFKCPKAYDYSLSPDKGYELTLTFLFPNKAHRFLFTARGNISQWYFFFRVRDREDACDWYKYYYMWNLVTLFFTPIIFTGKLFRFLEKNYFRIWIYIWFQIVFYCYNKI